MKDNNEVFFRNVLHVINSVVERFLWVIIDEG